MLTRRPLLPLMLAALLSACSLPPAGPGTNAGASGLNLVAEAEGGRRYAAGPVAVLELQGSYRAMGRQYGLLAGAELNKVYEAFTTYYIEKAPKRIPYDRMKTLAEVTYQLYPQRYKEVILGMAETSGLTLENQKILNSLEVLRLFDGVVVGHCSGLVAWGPYTGGGPLVFGRNNDDDEFFKLFSPSTVVVVLKPNDGSIPVAFIIYAGVIYAATGMNRDGLFLELNSGSAFDGYDGKRTMILVSLLSYLQDYSTVDGVAAPFKALRANMSSLVNAADPAGASSFECPPELECKRRAPDRDGLLAGTNHFVDPAWGTQFPETTAPDTEFAATKLRYTNLLAQAEKRKGQIDAEAMKAIFDMPLRDKDGNYLRGADGGATVAGTIQSIVAVPQTLTVHLKAPGAFDWQKIELGELLGAR